MGAYGSCCHGSPYSWLVSGGFEAILARKSSSLWRSVAASGGRCYRSKTMQQGKVHFAAWVVCKLQDGGLQGIAVMAGWILQDWKVLNCYSNLTRSGSGRSQRIYLHIQVYIYIIYILYIYICMGFA